MSALPTLRTSASGDRRPAETRRVGLFPRLLRFVAMVALMVGLAALALLPAARMPLKCCL